MNLSALSADAASQLDVCSQRTRAESDRKPVSREQDTDSWHCQQQQLDCRLTLRHDGDTLSVDSAQVGVLEEADKVRLRRLLEGEDSRSLEAQIVLEVW